MTIAQQIKQNRLSTIYTYIHTITQILSLYSHDEQTKHSVWSFPNPRKEYTFDELRQLLVEWSNEFLAVSRTPDEEYLIKVQEQEAQQNEQERVKQNSNPKLLEKLFNRG